MVFHVSEEERRKEEIPLDPSIPLHSVAKLLEGPDFCSKRHARRSCDEPIPTPSDLRIQSRELKKLRVSFHKSGDRDEQVDQMAFWFPDIRSAADSANKKPKLQPAAFRLKAKLKKASLISSYQTTPCPASDIGTLIKLPGEIRNQIYQLATLGMDPILVTMPFRTCGIGRCLHTSVGYNVPGITQTCKQLRWEALPIYLAENPAVHFDAGATLDGCTLRYLESLGSYADLIPKYILTLQRPIWTLDKFEEYALYRFSITTPKRDGSGDYTLEQSESSGRKICQCKLDKLVVGLNEKKKEGKPAGKAMYEFLDHDEFTDFVWRVKKTKQWPQHLAKCPNCKEVIFNN
ncbi:uncharacterized protein RCC_05520 [Ramularia collo-cygni]|uniref:F-box domain-containing protein n=1 Tax=Ramularia collo-cygni TaxID=112498 RepID=A0A2D3VDB8_9PEZI|nr:uncharacterized protein RCC_05520 [Ramularia collo-cygni]CZT19669.1 uncharacterized protein RCC_05520 [Ramularia collo-cygni]